MNANIFTDEKLWLNEWDRRWEEKKKKKFCKRCLHNEDTPSIYFHENGICNYCKLHDEYDKQYPIGNEGYKKFKEIVKEIKTVGKNQEYDVGIGVSGGADSSYMLHLAKEMGLKPLAIHFDNTWNSSIATQNIQIMTEKLDIDLFTHVVDNNEFNDILKSFLKAGVIEFDAATDIGLVTTQYTALKKYNIKYTFDGHSFRTEGIVPIGWAYMDGQYVDSVHSTFGSLKMNTFNNLGFWSQIKDMMFYKIKRLRPLWYFDYHKEDAKSLLSKEYNWTWYGGHHLENFSSIFPHTYLIPRRFGLDFREIERSGLVRSGQISRNEGIEHIRNPPKFDPNILDFVKKRLALTDEEFVSFMLQPKKTYKDFKTYKQQFEKWKWLFYVLMKMDMIPLNFYKRYTSKGGM